MFLSDEFWQGFAPDSGPGGNALLWAAAPVLLLLLLPAAVLLFALAKDLVWPGRDS
jgi:hypothetical protein